MDLRTKRTGEWVKHPLHPGACREPKCGCGLIAKTPEGNYCLEHYIQLPSCMHCGGASNQELHPGMWVCAACQDKLDVIENSILVRSGLAGHDEVSGHDSLSSCKVEMNRTNRKLSKKMRKAGYKDLSDFAKLRSRREAAQNAL